MKHLLPILLLAMMAFACRQRSGSPDRSIEKLEPPPKAANVLPAKQVAAKAAQPPKLDGIDDDSCWSRANWQYIDQNWMGANYDSLDFAGRYKLAWDKNHLYILAEIVDDTLRTSDKPLENYLADDCLIVYLDENRSGGNHQYNYNAFAYHLRLDGRVVDIGTDSSAHLYPGHCIVKRNTRGNTTTWEMAVRVFPDTYQDNAPNSPANLSTGKKMGFAIAYNDADRAPTRENLVGNVYIDGTLRDIAWIDASVFGELLLED
ncbi:CBM9 family sugar-binding protein [Chitinophaga horti]|uniref:CBM9 family sugar-binding protein n=1 Tax=Chitinophaga horti TaxID=2920382 RepID=A0ABY6J267_9BACT|nr:CBM9 family sugar-binding protein [Chitinophaga horti]UYQ93496.1 CBM9 family sugar-binding protein [Chitinophaga horti]